MRPAPLRNWRWLILSTKRTVTTDSVSHMGASVRGPGHAKLGEPSGDAWVVSQGQYGSVAVVSDGVGSCVQGEFGARVACKAAKKVLVEWVPDPRSCHKV